MNQKIKRIILVILLVIVATIIRTHYKYPPHPDHYALAQYTESIIREGYAPWVLHPMSLLGYYPLSKPSGFEYFSANLILITGLDLPNTFLLFSLFTAFYASFALYTMMRKWTKFEISLLSSFILLTMVTFALDTQNTAS
ncbi:hypothetical protein HN415_09145, partial [Candidatus Woesearchaeota archaeon]|nr:hypothetical protein [Candidatus Woesearchaeota archaeon]